MTTAIGRTITVEDTGRLVVLVPRDGGMLLHFYTPGLLGSPR